MSFTAIVVSSIYIMLGFMSWISLTCFLHDNKPELNKSWFAAMIIGIALAAVWPVSMTLLYFYEK